MVKRRTNGCGKLAVKIVHDPFFRCSFVVLSFPRQDREAKEKKRKLSRSKFICERRFRGPLRCVSGLLAA